MPLFFGPTFSTQGPRKAAEKPKNKMASLKAHLMVLPSTSKISLTGIGNHRVRIYRTNRDMNSYGR